MKILPGYRLLEKGEIIRRADKFWAAGFWLRPHFYGKRVCAGVFIRKKTARQKPVILLGGSYEGKTELTKQHCSTPPPWAKRKAK